MGINVLIVEDEAINRIGYESVVREAGYEVAGSAGSAHEAIGAALASRPSVALVDINPGRISDGLAVARELARRFDTQVVLITATHTPEIIHEAYSVGPVAVLRKPVMPLEIIQALEVAAEAHTGSP